MMAAFNVTALTDLGYDEKTSFIDPMESRYRSKAFAQSDLDNRTGDFSNAEIQKKMAFFNGLDAYRNVKQVEDNLVQYWSTHSSGAAPAAATGNGGKASSSTLATKASTTAAAAAGASTSSIEDNKSKAASTSAAAATVTTAAAAATTTA